MTKILFVKKQGLEETLTTDDIVRLFEESEDLEKIKAAVEKADDRILVTWATVEMKDKAGEIIPVSDVVRQQDTLLERGGPISDTHTNKIIGKTMAYKVMEHPDTNTMGILHLDKIFADNQLDDKVWNEIITGEKTGSSVGGFNTSQSMTRDPVTGEKAKVLEGFSHIETAMVDDPCNPMALNEAFSIVAKSNVNKTREVKKSELSDTIRNLPNEVFDKIEKEINEALEKNDGTKTQNGETNINKKDLLDDINTKKAGDNMEEDIKKTISDLTETVKGLTEEVTKLKKQDAPEKEPEEEKPKEPEDKKKADDEEEEKKKVAKEDEEDKEPKEEDKKKVKKEDAKSDIDGETDAPSPESPVVDDSNDADVFKKDIEKLSETVGDIKKVVEGLKSVDKSTTPLPGTVQEVTKAQKEFQDTPLNIATGKTKKTWLEVNKMNKDYLEGGI